MHLRKYLLLLLLVFGFILTMIVHPFFLGHSGWNHQAIAQEDPWLDTERYPRRAESPVPTEEVNGAIVPDWTQITFSTLPAFEESGGFSVPPEVVSELGYDPSRAWEAGQTPDEILMLGDFQDAGLQFLTLEDIAYSAGLDLNSVTLDEFELLEWQTIEDLVLATPELGELQVSEVQPIFDLLILHDPSFSSLGNIILNDLINNPDIAALSLGALDLSSYKLYAIPFLAGTRLENFDNWQSSLISGIPGLKEIPWSDFPNPLSGAGFVALFDIAYGEKEARRLNTITGSDVEGFEVPCDQDSCPYIELSGPPWLGATAVHGKQWIVGPAQMVRGGHGILAAVNGGKEPTGRHPFGPVFKVVLEKTSESEGTGQFAIYFRYCSGFLGCTPYFIGPVPWIKNHENDIIFVGLTPGEPPANIPSNPGLPPGFELPPGVIDPELPQLGSDECQTYKGVSLGAIEQAIAAIESYGGDYTAIGNYVCDRDGLCGRALGKYQFMTYNEHARSRILAHPGGAEFLKRAENPNADKTALSQEILQYFTVNDQEAAFSAWLKELIDIARAEGKTGDELIARVGEMHNAGPNGSSPSYGRRTVQEYDKALPAVEAACEQKGSCSGKLIHPAPGYPITSFFGWRIHPISGEPKFHSGIDYGTPMGTPIKASDGGNVAYAGSKGGYGKTVDIKHCDGRLTRYAHNSELLLGRGAVTQAQVISKSGSTGNSTGPHLHFEVHVNGQAVDPLTQIGR